MDIIAVKLVQKSPHYISRHLVIVLVHRLSQQRLKAAKAVSRFTTRLGFSYQHQKVIGGRYFPIARAGQVRVASRGSDKRGKIGLIWHISPRGLSGPCGILALVEAPPSHHAASWQPRVMIQTNLNPPLRRTDLHTSPSQSRV